MKAQELRDLGVEELQKKLEEARKVVFESRFQHSTGQLENGGKLRMAKKEVARLLTVIAEKKQG